MKKWVIQKPNPEEIQVLTKGTDLTPLIAAILASRGIHSVPAAAALLSAQELSDPFLLRDMQEAAECVNAAVDAGERICIYGDYDCDGITATVMLYSYLESIGADVRYYIPERADGYGMNEQSIRMLAQDGVSLIITVDNGISALKESELIASLDMKLVVTDHHQPGRVLPTAEAVVDPHRIDCPSPFKALCGAGVALKLIAAMDGGDYEVVLEQFGDLAAIGTIADVVSLEGENRMLVQLGLQYLQNTERLGLLSLMEASGIAGKPLSAHTVAFMLAPRINAAGRFGSPKQAAELLLADDPDTAEALAKALCDLNTMRKETEAQILAEIDKKLAAEPQHLWQRVLVLAGENWHHGVIGIVAARLLERYGKPCFLLSLEGDSARGSARSFGAFSVYQCLESCQDLLTHWGGHPGAGGMSLSRENLDAFDQRIQQFAAEHFPTMPVLTVDALSVPPELLNEKNVRGLQALEPFGEGNPSPLFALENAAVQAISPTKNGAHTKLRLLYGTQAIEAFWFFRTQDEIPCKPGDTYHFLVTLELSTYGSRTSVLVKITDARKSGIRQDAYFSAKHAYEAYQRSEPLPDAYYPRLTPTREELVSVYRAIPQQAVSLDALFASLNSPAINYCKLCLCCDIFTELGLISHNCASDQVARIPTTEKTDLETSATLRALREICTQRKGLTV